MEEMPTCCQQIVKMEFGKRHDTTDTTDFCPFCNSLQTCCRLVMGKSPTCYGLATGKLV